MKNSALTRVTAGSVLLATCGLAFSAGAAQAADASPHKPGPLTSLTNRLTSTNANAPVDKVEKAASLVKGELPEEASGHIYLRTPVSHRS